MIQVSLFNSTNLWKTPLKLTPRTEMLFYAECLNRPNLSPNVRDNVQTIFSLENTAEVVFIYFRMCCLSFCHEWSKLFINCLLNFHVIVMNCKTIISIRYWILNLITTRTIAKSLMSVPVLGDYSFDVLHS